jgi:hypothetical protein
MAGWKLALGCAWVVVLVTGCRSRTSAQSGGAPAVSSPVTQPAPPTPIAEKKAELGSSKTWDPQWDAVIEQGLPPEMLSAQAARAVRVYCPRFAQLSDADKREFWAYTFQALAGAEAGLNPTSDVHHTAEPVNKIDPMTHRPSRQEGLLQLKYQDAERYGCGFDWQRDRTLPVKDPNRTILQPARNLGCGIRIMQDQIITLGKPLVTRTSYWATLQPGTAGYRDFAKQMVNVPPVCGLRERRRRSVRGQ